jgi:hypothetical protein
LPENEVPRDQLRASEARTEPPTDAISRFNTDDALPTLNAADQVISLMAELGQMRGQVTELQARLNEIMAENEMMANVFAADDKVQASMAEAKKQKAKANEDNRALFVVNNKVIALLREVEHWKNRAEKTPHAKVDPASGELATLREEYPKATMAEVMHLAAVAESVAGTPLHDTAERIEKPARSMSANGNAEIAKATMTKIENDN